MKLPKQSINSQKGEDGLTIVKRIVEKELGWIFRKNHQEHDYGIDAFIDLTTDLRQVTGKSIALQVKTGQSYFAENSLTGWVYRDKIEHLNYYLNHEIPVIILLVDEVKSIVYWCLCDGEKTEQAGENWKIIVPNNQVLNLNSKSKLEKYVSPMIDYASQLQNFWEQNKFLKDTGRIIFCVDKESVLHGKYHELVEGIERLKVNPELIEASKSKMDIAIHGYDLDERELYEIEEVKNWVKIIFSNVVGLTYFLAKDKAAQFLRVFQLCKLEYIDKGYGFEKGRLKKNTEINLQNSKSFFEEIFFDLNLFTKTYNIPLEVNKELSFKLMEYFTGEALPDEIKNQE